MRVLAVLGCLLGAACIGKGGPRAEAELQARSGATLTGRAVFQERQDTVQITLELSGAPPGLHGAHIHETGDCSAADASSAGGHWNPAGASHGAPGQAAHLGDLGNIAVGDDGTGKLVLENEAWRIGDGSPEDVLGKAIVIHAASDDLITQPSGNSGARIGCGVIE